jgi:hypothetical protein
MELADVAAARREAIRTLGEIIADAEGALTIDITIRSANSQPLLRIKASVLVADVSTDGAGD